MKFTAQKDATLDDDYVDVKYRELTPTIHQIFQICGDGAPILLCVKDEEIHKVDMGDILYIEWVDDKSCIYTKDDIFTIGTSLARLEEILPSQYFFRISRIVIINIYKIKSLSNGFNFRLIAEMINEEKVMINRHYRNGLMQKVNSLAKEV